MANAHLAEGLYIYVTPAGSYYAVSSPDTDPARVFLRSLLALAQTPELSISTLQRLMKSDDQSKCLDLLQKYQQLGWVYGCKEPLSVPTGAFEDVLPDLLSQVSEEGKVLLADDQGFYLACSGYPHEVAEEISALTAEIAAVHQRRSGLLLKNLGINSQAWALSNSAGHSQLGFWPLFIGSTRFVIALSGIPHFNHNEFMTLVWMLSVRYSSKSS